MNKNTIELLEYNKIKEILKGYALSDIAKDKIEALEPFLDIAAINAYLLETNEGRAIADITSSIPIHSLMGMNNIVQKVRKGMVLSGEELETTADFLVEGRRLRDFMNNKKEAAPNISCYALSICEMQEVVEEIQRCILRGRVEDKATSALSKIRKKIRILEDRIKSKLDSVLKNDKYRSYIQDSVVSMRNGRYVIPVKNEHRNSVSGVIQDKSSSGSTVFVEPEEVKKAQDELNILRIEEKKEVFKVLSNLTNLVISYERDLIINIETMAHYDFIFAKAKYSKAIDGRGAKLNCNHYIKILGGRHPLLGRAAVPLDFEIGNDYRALVITGPNTGGKTVALKTVGLLTMMVQSGLHVPVEKESEFSIFVDILADIGDGQSIEQSLSTFSSHIKNVISILHCADPNTLVIIDEIGSGTEPGEGMGIAVAVLEEIYHKGATLLATTHYNEIKHFARVYEGFTNGCMEFDINTLKPLYKLSIGKAGESNAFLISLRLGMNKNIIERAHEITYKSKKDYSNYEVEMKALRDNIIVQQKLKEEAELSHEAQVEKFKKANIKNAINEKQKAKPSFNIGDCVYISYMERTGIVCELENSKGEVGVMVMKKKLKINKKRLSIYIEKEELYPEEYDMDIILKSKDYRKKNKLMGKRHVEGVSLQEE